MMSEQEKASYIEADDSTRLILTPSSTAQATYFFVQEIGRFKTTFPYFTERERLHSYLILHTLSGRGRLHYQGQQHVVGQGDLFFINCMEYQRYEAMEEDDWEFLWVHVQGSTLDGYYEQFCQRQIPVCHLAESSSIPELMRQLLHVQIPRNNKTELISSQLIVQLLTEVVLTSIHTGEKNNAIPASILDLQQFLENHYTDPITLDDLAQKYNTNKFQLSRDFKQYIGLPPIEYLINIRINAAKNMLRYSNKSIQQIASAVGIYNVSHFINLFKARVDCTPLAYRKEWT
ncbi:AraC family transcriptional regulator [Paenibacillus dauci]|uniref:AraC family transcriptional regulator n=1 Tax=Paenibacillus dauci TaxID=1567106 RepID=UPI000696827E|nr:AraC family transcriptional regulator [Paenibacillus dauci]